MRVVIFIFFLSFLCLGGAAPSPDSSESKIRQKRKDDALDQLVDSGIAKKRPARKDEVAGLTPVVSDPAVQPTAPDAGARVKKAPNVGPCGRTTCGPLVSAQGSGVRELEAQRSIEYPDQLLTMLPTQAKTYDLGYSPVVGYGQSSGSLSSSGSPFSPGYGNSFFSQGLVDPVTYSPFQPIHQVSPVVMRHPLQHQYDFNYNLQRLQDFYPLPGATSGDNRRPVYFSNQPFTERDFASARTPLVCQPFSDHDLAFTRQPLVCQPYRGRSLPDISLQKSINNNTAKSVDEAMSAFRSGDEDQMKDHLQRVNDIKSEIVRLNEVAQKIVDQQETLARMQANHMGAREAPMARQFGMYPMGMGYGGMGGGMSSSQSGASAMASSQGGSMSSHMPFPYMRSTHAGNFPSNTEDMQFFMNMLHTLRKLSDVQQRDMAFPQDKAPKYADDKVPKYAEDVFNDLYRGQYQPQREYQQPQREYQQPPPRDYQQPSQQSQPSKQEQQNNQSAEQKQQLNSQKKI